MKIKNLIYTAIAALLVFTSCIQELRKDDFISEAISGLIKVQLELPEGFENVSVNGMKVLFTDNSTGLTYTENVNADGYAEVRVAFGTYTISAETKINNDNMIDIFNGMSAGLRVTPDNNTASATINLKHSRSSQIIIKEFYFGGCKNVSTGKSYQNDKYVVLYNNSDEVAYLDSLCIGTAYPWNAPTNGKFADFSDQETGVLMDGVPNANIGWMFDGTGKDIPLQPGQEVVIALNAIDHTTITPNSVNLGVTGYYALWNSTMGLKGQSTPNAGVIHLNGFWKTGTSTAYVISVSSPALFIYRMGGRTIEKFIEDTYTINPKTPNQATGHCLLVEKENVIDGVECLKSNSDTKRLIPEVDNGFITMTNYQGHSVHRKVDEEATAAAGGRIVYQDTNNSSNDFYVREYASLTGK